MSEIIECSDFEKVVMRVGKIIDVQPNEKARIPAYILEIDFGSELGVKISSAQLTVNYKPEDLLNKHIVGFMNFAAKRVAGVKSEVLVLGAVGDNLGTKLLFVDEHVEIGCIVNILSLMIMLKNKIVFNLLEQRDFCLNFLTIVKNRIPQLEEFRKLNTLS